MPENSDFTPHYQDDPLASFVDRLLSGMELDPAQEAASDEELRDMQAMAMRFARISRPAAPPPAMARRMKATLAGEFQSVIKPASVPAAKTQPADSWWSKVKEIGSELTANQQAGKFRARRRQQTFSFVLAGVTVITLVFAAFFVPMPGTSNQTVAAAFGDNPLLAVIAVVVGLVIVAGIWFASRRKR